MKLGKLYVVSTPIGNLEDITLRAVRMLKEVDLIACEDTRVTKKLLEKYNIKKKTVSYHEHSRLKQLNYLENELKSGKDIALVTDAGTPGISDPGNKLVQNISEEGIEIIPIPGASALTAIASVAGINIKNFMFLGFPPHKKGRETFFKSIASSNFPVIYYDSPHRVIKNLELLQELSPGKRIIIGRELTKIFEEIIRGNISQILAYLGKNENKVKGEFSIIAY